MRIRVVAPLTLFFLGCGAAFAAPTAASVKARRVEIHTSDVMRFLNLYDATHHHPTAEQLQKQYLDPGSPGLHQFVKSRIKSAKKLAAAIEKYPQVYADVHECVAGLPDVRKRLRAVFSRLASVYPQAKFPPVTFVVGRNNTGGTTTASGVIIGVEVICRADWLQPDMTERLVHLIAHEYAHVQQPAAQVEPPPNATLLFKSLIEGGAEFIDELISGEVSGVHLQKWTRGKRCKIEQRFGRQAEGTDVSGWLYNGPGTPQKPGDLGYWIGYRITKAYYLHAADKRQAIFDILHVTNANASTFLEQSGWNPKTDCKITYGAQTKAVAPTVFAPGVISAASYEASPAFMPNGKRVYFSVYKSGASTIMVSRRDGAGWSKPRVTSFSRRWSNFEPTMAPDGSFILFVSNRPIEAGDKKPIDGFFNGKRWPGRGGNLWRVDRRGDGWSTPQRLPATINRSTSIFSPSIAADGSVYFMRTDPKSGYFHIWRSAFVHGVYQQPVRMKLGDDDTEEVDPAVAPDGSFIVYSLRHPAKKDHNRLKIAFRNGDGWSEPVDLGDTINAASNVEARLGSDGRTLYFSSRRHVNRTPADGEEADWNNGKSNIWYVSLAPWLDRPRGSL